MNSFIVYPLADQQLDEIWRYSYTHWGEQQANQYTRTMEAHFQLLADRESRWRTIHHLFAGRKISMPPAFAEIYMSRYEKHVVYFRPVDDRTIGIMSLLHQSMDMPHQIIRLMAPETDTYE